MRLLALLLPGICSPLFLLFLFMRGYGGLSSPLWDYVIFGGFLLLTLGCAFFYTLLDYAPAQEEEPARNKRFCKAFFLFLLLQIFVIPVVGLGTAAGCSAIVHLAN